MSSGTKNQFAWWYAPSLCCVMLLTQSSVGLSRVQLWQVSSSSTPAAMSTVETAFSSVQDSRIGSHGSSLQAVTTRSASARRGVMTETLLAFGARR